MVFEDPLNNQKATVMKYNGSGWVYAGNNGFSDTSAFNTAIAIDGSGTPYVVFQDSLPGPATVMKLSGNTWVTVGNANISGGSANIPSIAINGTGVPYVAYEDGGNGNKATVMKYDGSNWVPVGSVGFSSGAAYSVSIAINKSGVPYVAYTDSANGNKATVMEYNGSNWVSVGSTGFSAGEAGGTMIALNGVGTPYVLYQDALNGWKNTVMTPGSSIEVKNITNKEASLTISPNPNQGSFTLLLSTPTNEPAQITITNILGEKIKECTIPTNQETTIQLDAPPGMYFLTALTNQGTQSTKIVVQ